MSYRRICEWPVLHQRPPQYLSQRRVDKWIGAAPRMRAISGLFGSRPSIGFPNWQECSEMADSFRPCVFFFVCFFYSNKMPLCGERRMLPPGQRISGVISTYTQQRRRRQQQKKHLQPPALLSDSMHFTWICGLFGAVSEVFLYRRGTDVPARQFHLSVM